MATSRKTVGNKVSKKRTVPRSSDEKSGGALAKRRLETCLKSMKLEPKTKKAVKKKEFVKVLDNIVSRIEKRVTQDKNFHDIFFANKGSVTKLVSTYSLYGEDPEEFTIRYVTEPLLEFLGYDDIAYEPKLGTNRKKADLALILENDRPKDRPEIILVEGKSIGKDITAQKVRDQLKRYLSSNNKNSLYTPYMGILTDGLSWELHILKTDGTFGKPFIIDIQPLLRWSYLKRMGQEPTFPMTAYRRFINVLSRQNIKVYGDCLRYGVEIRVLDDKGKAIGIKELPVDRSVEMAENSVPGSYRTPENLGIKKLD